MSIKHSKGIVIGYIICLLLFVGAIGYVAHLGQSLDLTPQTERTTTMGQAWGIFSDSVAHHLTGTIGMLLIQILVILFVARTMGVLFRRIGQPAVIGEIVAGIMLGPSLLGQIAPGLFEWLFPTSSLGSIQLLSNFGLILFMFVVGMELRLSDIRRRFAASITISHIGIFVPFALSLPLCYYIYTEYVGMPTTTFLAFSLFVGISMSITAFPVLARIIQERGLQRKPIGKLALSTAAASDITAWLMLAGIIAISQSGSMLSMVYNLGFFLVYLGVMFGIIRPLFRMVGKLYVNSEVISHTLVGVIFFLLLLSSWVTELLSMHALFGAFMLGLVMPEDLSFRRIITDKVEDVSLMLLLPLFFVSSGLQTELGLISGHDTWMLLAIFTLIAVLGKVGGTYLSARLAGETPRNSIYLGALMNTRGLMELVVLAIGLEIGILSPTLYAVLVLMTVITTIMTMPMIQLINAINAYRDRRREHRSELQTGKYKALISFGKPQSGIALMHLGNQLLGRGASRPELTAVHITTDTDRSTIDADSFYESNFGPLIRIAQTEGYNVDTEHIFSEHVESAIVDKLRREQYNLLLIGAGIRLSSEVSDQEAYAIQRGFESKVGEISLAATEQFLSIGTLVRDKMKYFIKYAPSSVGILLNRGYTTPERILLVISNAEDLRMLSYARTLSENNAAHLDILATTTYADRLRTQGLLPTEQLLEGDTVAERCVGATYQLVVLSYDEWLRRFDTDLALVACLPSCLILSLKTPHPLHQQTNQ